MQLKGKLKKKGKWILAATMLLLAIAYYFCLPSTLFSDPYSTVLLDRDNQLLSATIADDGQWRFPRQDHVPEKLMKAMILYEDKRFFSHPGIDVLSVGRAMRQNWRAGKVVSGASTLTMQVIRLSRKNPPRTVFEKVKEMVLATRLELRCSKNEILNLYAAHAPYGGNVVGVQAAAWRYFGRDLDELSWAEAALLAVLPNNPSLIHLSRNRERLKNKRDALLERLMSENYIDELTLALSKEEDLPESPIPLPQWAHHLLHRAAREGQREERIKTTINGSLQRHVERIVEEHHVRLKGNQIFNGAAIIVEVSTGNVLAYVGNTQAGSEHEDQVDVIAAPRSTGSILKPFLYAAMMDEGKMLPGSLIPDVPTVIDGFSPKNFSHSYDGAVHADKALIRSLNIPAVHELKEYRYEKFHHLLVNMGLTTLNRPPDHYGLSLILGGAEGSLWDITAAYASMARTLNQYFETPGKKRYRSSNIHALQYVHSSQNDSELDRTGELSAASIWLTFDALKELYRPGEETGWRYFNSTKKIAWKTGTSFGFRDAWAVGVNPDYAVGVWVGNADGEGRPGLTGSETAAPLLFDLFNILPGHRWFQQPVSEMVETEICISSGQRESALCDQTAKQWVTKAGIQTLPCTYHKRIHVTLNESERVNSDCAPIDNIKTISWFVLPPIQEYFYRARNISYQPLPPYKKECRDPSSLLAMDIVYPKEDAEIYVPRELDGTSGQTLFEAVHRSSGATVFWHLDGAIVGVTKKSHRLAFAPNEGEHLLTLVDEKGEILQRAFKVLSTP